MRVTKTLLLILTLLLVSCTNEENTVNYKEYIGVYDLHKCITDENDNEYLYGEGIFILNKKEDNIKVLFIVELIGNEKVEFQGYIKDDYIFNSANDTLFGILEKSEYGLNIIQPTTNGTIIYEFWKIENSGSSSNPNNNSNSSGSNPNNNGSSNNNSSSNSGSNSNNSTSTTKQRCAAKTKKGTRCKRYAEPGSIYCWQHK